MSKQTVQEALQSGAVTLRELRGITDEEMAAGVEMAKRVLKQGQHQAAADMLTGLLLLDPFREDVWLAIADLCQRERCPSQARFFNDMARIMA